MPTFDSCLFSYKMFNFLDPKLMPKVSCSAPSMDNYEIDNLINPNEAIKARGFLAYTVIKPPVEMEFEFICPVNISYITLNTTVGTQRCTGIEIFARTTSNQYIPIGKAVYEKSHIVFCNSRKFSREKPPPLCEDRESLYFFKSNTTGIFTNTSAIKLVIFRTHRSVPCLASIKVFGEPARSCSITTIETIQKLMGILPRNPVNTTNPTVKNKEVDQLQIPEAFKDDLTCDIMTIPMTLPSGKTIDRDTLEKHLENEKSFGRKPGDPFTGLKFTETRKAVLNVALKSRIDMFLLKHSNNPITYALKRTVGSGNHGETPLKRAKIEKCSVCNDTDTLYIIPCEHFYCRTCLLKEETWECNVCHKAFNRNCAKRYHKL